MKTPRLLLALFVLSSLAAFAAPADKPLTAFETLALARKQLGEAVGTNLLSMRCENAKLRPRYWWIRFFDASLFLKVRAVQMIGPEMVRNVEPANIFDGGDQRFVIRREELKYDSEKCILFIERCARESGVPLHSLDILLEKPHEGETSPLWTFEWFDEKRDRLGTMKISATTGKIIEIVDLKIKSPRYQDATRKSLGENVEDTFLGIGADMEEFFTGKRTVDKEGAEESAPAKDAPPAQRN
ncbi:MAG: hypothetical protein IT578_06380 [Verrucomicrobiae bacterium]|nr:hypothetical protein [Verrucomicrobiae bacterium]